MTKYDKLIAAIIGLLVVIFGPDFLGLGPEGTVFGLSQELVAQIIGGILTAIGVYVASNKPD